MIFISNFWQDLSADWQDGLILFAYLLPVFLLAVLLQYRLEPKKMIKTLLRRYKKVNMLIVFILGICLSVSIAIQSTASAYKSSMAKIANRFELVVTAPGSKIDMMLATVYLQPTATPLLKGDIYQRIVNDEKVEIAAPIAYGDSYNGYPIVGSTNKFIQYLSDNKIDGNMFSKTHQAIVGASVGLKVGDTFVPQHGMQKSFAPTLTNLRAQKSQNKGKKEKSIVHDKASERYFCPPKTTKTPVLSQSDSGKDTLVRLLSADDSPNPHKQSSHDAIITVVGKMSVTQSPWDKAIITPVESVWQLHGLPNGHAPHDTAIGEPFDMKYFSGTPAILVHPKQAFHAYSLSNKYTSAKAMAFRPPTVLSKLNAKIDDMTDILSRVAFLTICLVLSLTIVTIALLAKLFEKHFQLLHSIGSPKRFIVSIMWSYVTFLALCSTFVGCFLGFVLSRVFANYIEGELSVILIIQFGWTEFTLCAMFFTLSSLLGLIPAFIRK